MIWCIQIKDVGALGPREYKLYNTEKRSIKIVSEKELLKSNLSIENLQIDNSKNNKVVSRMGSLDKITNKLGVIVLGKYSDGSVKIVDSSGIESRLSFNDFQSFYNWHPAYNAKISHGTIMGINWSIPLLDEESYLSCTIGWSDWHDFILDYGRSQTELKLRLTSKAIKLKFSYSSDLSKKILDFVEDVNMVMVDNVVKFDTFDNLLSFLSSLEKRISMPVRVNFKFLESSSGWNPDDWDLLEFYELLYGTDNYNYSTNTAKLFISQSKEIIDHLTPLCQDLKLSFTHSPYTTLSEITSSTKLNSFELQHDFFHVPIFYLCIPYVEPPSFFSGLKSWFKS